MIPGLTPPAAGTAAATPRQRQELDTGVAFERLLLGEMARTMTASAGLQDGPAGLLTAQLPEILADAVIAGGGIGLAAKPGDGPVGGRL